VIQQIENQLIAIQQIVIQLTEQLGRLQLVVHQRFERQLIEHQRFERQKYE